MRKDETTTHLGIDVLPYFEDEGASAQRYWDDLSGKELDARPVKEARAEEIR